MGCLYLQIERATSPTCTSGGFFFYLMQRLVAYFVAPRALPPTEAGWRLRQLPTGHDAMITIPKELADLLLEVV